MCRSSTRYAAHLHQPLPPAQQALVNHAHARRLYLASRTVVRADPRSSAERQANYSAGVLGRQTAEAAVINPATATTRHDPTLRVAAVGGTALVVGVVGVKVAAAAVAEEAAAYTAFRWIGWRAAVLRFTANTVGQGVGNYVITGDAQLAVKKINWVSPFLAAGGIPLVTSSIGTAAFKVDFEQKYRSVFNDRVSGSAFVQDAIIGYGLGQATRASGFDNQFRSPAASNFVNEIRYQTSLQLGPRWATGVGNALPQALEAGNRAASGAVRKVDADQVKKHLPR